jgi:hypothetical protein
MRDGAEYFTAPAGAAQRRYEALRAYFLDDMPAAEVAGRFGYSTASVHQMATLLRSGRMRLFADARPGPKGPTKATGPVRDKVLALRARQLPVTQIAQILAREGTPISAQTVWKICDSEGLPRLRGDDTAGRGPATRLAPVKAAALGGWPAEAAELPCDHAGLLLLAPAMTELGLHELIGAAGYPATSQLSAWHSIATLLLAAAIRIPRAHHIDKITDDEGLAFFLGLTALPKATHLGSYSYRTRRESSMALLTGLIRRLRALGLATGEKGFNLDSHAIRHHGDAPVPEEHYVPARSQRTRSVLTFFANDHASSEMVYANAGITKTEQAREIIAFAGYWRAATGAGPGLLVFDSQLTTYKILDELTARKIAWLTLRQRGKAELARLAPCPPAPGNTTPSTARAATGTPTCTKTRSRSRASPLQSARSRSRTSAATSPPCSSPTTCTMPPRPKTCSPGTPSGCSSRTNSTPPSPASISTRCPRPSRSTSTWTPRSPSSPATSTGSSPAASRATPAPPPTPSGGTSSTTPEPCTSSQTASPVTSPCAATTPP